MRPILTLICGVHRSGTSLLTLGLRAAGAHAGDFPDISDVDNPAGYAEHPAVRQFNDRLLAHLGASWDNWGFRAGLVDWAAASLAPWEDEATSMLQSIFVGPGPFVLKDPRCATLAPFWERVVPRAGFALRRIIILRDPAEVAESQRQRAARNPFRFPVIVEAEPMAALWAVTMSEVLDALEDDATLLVGHADLLTAPAPTLATAAAFIDLRPDEAVLARFAVEDVKPDLYRARSPQDVSSTGEGAWMQAARRLFGDLARPGLPRRLPKAEARAIAGAQDGILSLRLGLSAVQASIARMQEPQTQLRSRIDGLNRLLRCVAPLTARAGKPALAGAIERATSLPESAELAESSFAFSHTVGLLFLFAGRRADGLAWLERVRTRFGHANAFVELERKLLNLPADQA